MTEEQAARRAFDRAVAIVKDEILLHERPHMAEPGWFLRRKLRRALALFDRVLQTKPDSWNTMWLMAKVHQRLGDKATAFSWMERAYLINPSQLDVTREASLMASDLGRQDSGIAYARRATQIEPENAGLVANLALSYLLANRLEEAKREIARSLKLDPNDSISKTIHETIMHFADKKKTPPSTTGELREYWLEQRESQGK